MTDRTATEIMIEFDRKHGPTQQTLLLFALSDWYEALKAVKAMEGRQEGETINALHERLQQRRFAAEQRLYSLAERLTEAVKEFAPK